jgi:hypothetical protein
MIARPAPAPPLDRGVYSGVTVEGHRVFVIILSDGVPFGAAYHPMLDQERFVVARMAAAMDREDPVTVAGAFRRSPSLRESVLPFPTPAAPVRAALRQSRPR